MKKTNNSSVETEFSGARPRLIQTEENALCVTRRDRRKSTSARALKKILKEVKAVLKLVKQENKSLVKTVESQDQEIRELTSQHEELKQHLAQLTATYADQNTRVGGVENHVINIYERERMTILARSGSRPGSNSNRRDPTQTSAFM